MPYKCEYDVQFACGNCKHIRTSICHECRKRTEYNCPLGKGKTYPEGRKVCRKCLFEPESEETNMIMTEEELDEQIAMYEAEEAKGLKPCRCGVMPQLEVQMNFPKPYFYGCTNCGLGTINCKTEAEAKEEWNKLIHSKKDNCAIKDSGERREFETGAVRDMSEGKGLMVVMPAAALLRLSRHYEHGAKKYGKFNWQKGIPVSSFMDSALRHIMKYLDGWDDEDHLAAAAFNILGAMEMEAHKPAMQDIPYREGKETFNYKQGE